METKTGIITFIAVKRNYGFIQCDDGPERLFFHGSACISPDNLSEFREGMPVEFMIHSDEKFGTKAIGVVVT